MEKMQPDATCLLTLAFESHKLIMQAVWQKVPRKKLWTCKLCLDGRQHTQRHLERHEQTALHQTLVTETASETQDARQSDTEPGPSTALPPLLAIADNATRNLLRSMAGSATDSYDLNATDAVPLSPTFLDPIYGWGQFTVNENTKLAQSAEEEGIALIAKSLLDRFEELSGDESEREWSEVDEEEIDEPIVTGTSSSLLPLFHNCAVLMKIRGWTFSLRATSEAHS